MKIMKIFDKILAAVLVLEIAATAVIYFFFSAWSGGECNQPGVFNPLGQYLSPGPCVLIALRIEKGGVLFYVSLDTFFVTVLVFVLYKIVAALQKLCCR